MQYIHCDVELCKYYDDGECGLESITISDEKMTGAGFFPQCTDYVEIDDDIWGGEGD